MKILNLGAFNAYYGRPADEWDQWCNGAANTWATVTGDMAKAEQLRKSCVDQNKGGKCSTFATPPWTTLGLACRGLPVEFSTSASVTQAGAAGKILGVATDVASGGAGTSTPLSPQSLPSHIQTVLNRNLGVKQGAGAQGVAPEQFFPDVSKGMSVPLMVGVGVAAVGALWFLTQRKKGGALSGYRRRRRRR